MILLIIWYLRSKAEKERVKLRIIIGTKSLMEDFRVDLKNSENILSSLQEQGKTAILMAVDNNLTALFAMKDKIKESAYSAIATLKRMGIEVCMLT